jgi:hypothetical protein
MLNKGNQVHNFISSSGSGTVINYGSDFLTSYGSGSTSKKVTVPVPVPQHCLFPVKCSSHDVHIFEQSFQPRSSYIITLGSKRI